jgi:formylglycine-generating enzyme
VRALVTRPGRARLQSSPPASLEASWSASGRAGRALRWALAGAVAASLACSKAPPPEHDAGAASTVTATAPAPGAVDGGGALPVQGSADAGAPADAGSDATVPGDASVAGPGDPDGDGLPGTSEGCPADMVLVAGEYCRDVNQRCKEHHDEYKKDEERKKKTEGGEASTVSERCLRYHEPTECLSKKTPVRYCVDRYEWPNKKGELPLLLVSWMDAKKMCEDAGKRLCTVAEFDFACEGPDMWPYTYGFARDATKCNIDKQYRKRQKKLSKYERCMNKPACKAELERLDQRLPAGSLPECVSPFGAYDMNGNINEWVMRPGKKYPDRSGLKGGWWGPVRGRCRPTVGFHKEEDYGYEEGFRCCKDAAAAPGDSAAPPAPSGAPDGGQ